MSEHRIIRLKKVKELTSLSDSSIWRREKEGLFPSRRYLGGRAVGWFYDEVLAWLDNVERKEVATHESLRYKEPV